MNNKLNKKSETNRVETIFSSVWLFCLFRILQKIKNCDCQETTVTFTNGISTGSKSVSGVNGFVEFAALSNTSNKINKEQSKFVWNVTKILEKTDGTGQALETDTITFYTILADPTGTTTGDSPWNTADTTTDNKIQPWVTALEFTIQTANTKSKATPASALGQLTTYLHSGHGMTYDTTSGASGFGTFYATGNGTFRLSDYISQLGTTVNCYDQAAGVFILGRILGIDVQYAFMSKFGYINTVNLVGVGNCNNPFYSSMNPPYNIPVVGSDDAGRTYFGNHAFTMLDNDVYDACALSIGVSFNAYLTTTIDTSTAIENAVAGSLTDRKFPSITIKIS
jgi:hypothetical protein